MRRPPTPPPQLLSAPAFQPNLNRPALPVPNKQVCNLPVGTDAPADRYVSLALDTARPFTQASPNLHATFAIPCCPFADPPTQSCYSGNAFGSETPSPACERTIRDEKPGQYP